MAPPEYPVKLGSMLYTLVDPNPGHEVAYNRWYERDHFYAGCMIGPWLFAGSRWVAPRVLKDLRVPNDDTNKITSPWDAGSYVAIYWIHADHHDDHVKWAGEQVHWLYQNDRGFADRTHRHTAMYDYVDTIYRDEDPVPIELALDRPYEGQMSVATDLADGVSAADFDAWIRSEGLPPVFDNGSRVAMVSQWTPIQLDDVSSNAPMDLGSPTGDDRRLMQLFFTETDVRESWDRVLAYVDRINASGLATVVFASPFFRTVLGTDTYTDELW